MCGPHSLFSVWTNQINKPYSHTAKYSQRIQWSYDVFDEGYLSHMSFANWQGPMKNREKTELQGTDNN